jgi:hypothetical protein
MRRREFITLLGGAAAWPLRNAMLTWPKLIALRSLQLTRSAKKRERGWIKCAAGLQIGTWIRLFADPTPVISTHSNYRQHA